MRNAVAYDVAARMEYRGDSLEKAVKEILSNAKPNARLSIVALHRSEVPVNFLLVMMKQLHLVGAMEYPDDYTLSLDVLSETDVSPMVTHRFPLERFDEALEVARDSSAGAKVMIVGHDD